MTQKTDGEGTSIKINPRSVSISCQTRLWSPS